MIELDLFFQVWRSECKAPNHDIKLLIEAYKYGYTPQEFYDLYVYLPF